LGTAWSWDFGDGATDDTQNPEHTYTAPGFYTVSLTIDTGSELKTETKTDYINVIDASAPPMWQPGRFWNEDPRRMSLQNQ